MRTLVTLILVIFLNINSQLHSQGSSGSLALLESRHIVDMPTAGILDKSSYCIYTQFFTSNGFLLDISASPFTNFSFGLSYSAVNLIGDGEPSFQGLPGVQASWRVIDETKSIPAILIGANTQGRGFWYKSSDRFQTLSPGVFLALSKNFSWAAGFLALHGGIGYSFESNRNKGIPDFWVGIEQSISHNSSISLEYNANLDDNTTFLNTKGLLNTALRWSFIKGFTFELIFRDLLNHTKNAPGFERWLGVEYCKKF